MAGAEEVDAAVAGVAEEEVLAEEDAAALMFVHPKQCGPCGPGSRAMRLPLFGSGCGAVVALARPITVVVRTFPEQKSTYPTGCNN